MPTPSVITIGTFDGVHLGHRAILRRARTVADERGARVVAFALDPHPARLLRPDAEPPRLITRDQKLRRLRDAGADEVVLLEPTRELLGQTPEQFIESLVSERRPVAIVEGPDFRFGKGRKGDVTVLRQLGARWGFDVHVEPPAEAILSNVFGITVSSTAVRWLVGRGRVLDAAICLDQPHVLTAPVVAGEKRGRDLGVPTANLAIDALNEQMIPPDGVYAGTVTIHAAAAAAATADEPTQEIDDAPRHAAAVSIGVKPTFEHAPLAVEAHLLDFEGDLYDRTVSVRFARWLRGQVRYPTLAGLRTQLERDIEQVRWCERRGLLDPPRDPVRLRAAAG